MLLGAKNYVYTRLLPLQSDFFPPADNGDAESNIGALACIIHIRISHLLQPVYRMCNLTDDGVNHLCAILRCRHGICARQSIATYQVRKSKSLEMLMQQHDVSPSAIIAMGD